MRQLLGLAEFSMDSSHKIQMSVWWVFPDLKSGPLTEDLIPLAYRVAVYSKVEQTHCDITVIDAPLSDVVFVLSRPIIRDVISNIYSTDRIPILTKSQHILTLSNT